MNHMSTWNNKLVWVTGASSGIGKACAEAWARKGAKVVLSSRKQDALEAVAQPLREEGCDVHVVTLDLADSDSLPGVAAHAEASASVPRSSTLRLRWIVG